MRYRRVSWKRNVRKIPQRVQEKLQEMDENIVVGVVKKIPREEIDKNVYAHVGLVREQGNITCEKSLIPDRRQGKNSSCNRAGWYMVYRNRPKVIRTYSCEVPNWGDWSKGSHEISWDREVYERRYQGPPLLALNVKILGQEANGDVIVRFWIDQCLVSGTKNFEESLLFQLNLLQENVGGCDIYSSKATSQDYLSTLYVHWEILPPGTGEEQINFILKQSSSSLTSETRQRLQDRFSFLKGLNPISIVVGTSGFRRYTGYVFGDDLVMFDNVEYGNALYVMFEQWEDLSKRSRLELLNSRPSGFQRIVHRAGWKNEVRKILYNWKHRKCSA